MTHEEMIDQVRSNIEDRLRQSNLPHEPLVGETILFRDGHYCGRQFEWPHARACWFIEEQQIKLYDGSGRLLISYLLEPTATHDAQPAAPNVPCETRVA